MDTTITIQVEKVEAVLLGDGWHNVEPGTFGIGEFRFTEASPSDRSHKIVASSRDRPSGIWVTWKEGNSSSVVAALTAVYGIRLAEP